MGLKTTDYKIERNGIKVPEAYAQINQLSVTEDSTCYATFKIQQTRDAMELDALDYVNVQCNVNKSLPVYEQVYNFAKETEFVGWEDDIVEAEAEVSK